MRIDAQGATDAEIMIRLRDRGRKADRIQHGSRRTSAPRHLPGDPRFCVGFNHGRPDDAAMQLRGRLCPPIERRAPPNAMGRPSVAGGLDC